MSDDPRAKAICDSLRKAGAVCVHEAGVSMILADFPALIEPMATKAVAGALGASDRQAVGLLMTCTSDWFSGVLRDVGIQASLQARFEAVMTTPRLIELMGQFEAGKRSLAPIIKVAFIQRSLFAGLAGTVLEQLKAPQVSPEKPLELKADEFTAFWSASADDRAVFIRSACVGSCVAMIDVPSLAIDKCPVTIELALRLLGVLVGCYREETFAWTGIEKRRVRLTSDSHGFGLAISRAGERPLAIAINPEKASQLARFLIDCVVSSGMGYSSASDVLTQLLGEEAAA